MQSRSLLIPTLFLRGYRGQARDHRYIGELVRLNVMLDTLEQIRRW